ncbi:3'-5' exonuclease [Bacillus tianshenii]|nr:3'-5' exonuclease [Bacillus tianshenii]
MAYMVPEGIRTSATAGERLLFQTLKRFLPDDYIVYFEPEIRGKRPDFVIIGPDLGLIVLEVKDYTRGTLLQLNQDEWTIVNKKGEQAVVKSPIKQARDYMFHLVDELKKDKALIQTEGKYRFHLKFPCGRGAVFTRLYQRQLVEDGLYSVIDPNFCLTRDEIDPDSDLFSEENLIEKILNMFTVPFRLKEPLEDDEIQAIRYHLFPEVRISAEFKERVPYRDQLLLSLHDIKTMDLHQENLAKQLGDKNRLIRGVAGSGKTLILASRAKMLNKQHPDWKVLVLCYNISLAQNIKQMIIHQLNEPEDLLDYDENKQNDGLTGNIIVRNFHAWLKHDLKVKDFEVARIIEKLENNEAIFPKYDAILIDEGQDFAPEWLQLVSKLLNPETKSLLLVEDRAQNIYRRKRSYVQDTGLDFRGRSKVLTINYRNTSQIVDFAWRFYQTNSHLKDKTVSKEVDGTEIIAPQSTRRKGPEPAIYRANSLREEIEMVARQMKKLHETKNVPYDDMLVLYRVKRAKGQDIIGTVQRTFQRHSLPHYWLTENEASKRSFEKNDGKIKISTIDSSKGLDFQAVFIINVNNMPFALEEDKEREVSLLYIGMTRATEYLCVSYSGVSAFTGYFERVLGERGEIKRVCEIKGEYS